MSVWKMKASKTMKKFPKRIAECFISVVITILLTIGIRIIADGMWLVGIPKQDDVMSVSISYQNVKDGIKEIETKDEELIDVALNSTDYLKYNLFKKADNDQEALVAITYHLLDGTDKIISANRNAVFWNGKSYILKEDNTFVNIIKAVFFSIDGNE